MPLEALPRVARDQIEALNVEIGAVLPSAPRRGCGNPGRANPANQAAGPVRDDQGRIVDGRDGWLSTIAFHAVYDASAAGRVGLEAAEIAQSVWRRFAETADLERPAGHGARFSIADAERQVADKLRLLADGMLPPRDLPAIEPDYQAPVLTVAEARERL